jgi:nitrite reductase/ring-hydroxylating ferredoxin subunit
MAGAQRLICPSAALVDGELGVRFQVGPDVAPRPAFAVRFGGRVYAYVNECRHQATELDWNHGEFFDSARLYLVCASHGAAYEPASGVCVMGPCRGKRLKSVPVFERDGRIFCSED